MEESDEFMKLGPGARTTRRFTEREKELGKIDMGKKGVVLSDDEHAALENEVPALAATFGNQANFGPRSIRGFFYRYLLARSLLRELGEDVDPVRLAKDIARSYRASPKRDFDSEGDRYKEVVAAVR